MGTATDWRSVSVGTYHACAINTSGQVWCWGQNSDGEVGDATRTQRTSPVRAGTASNWVSLATGNATTCAIAADASLWCWGFGSMGQTGGVGTVSVPTRAGTKTWLQAAIGTYHTCAVDTGHDVYCFGSSTLGALGFGTTTSAATPTKVANLKANAVTANADTTLLLRAISTPPAPPTAVTATAQTGGALVSWSAATNVGGSPLVSATATAIRADTGAVVGTCSSAATNCTITGLSAGLNYLVSVTATNATATSASSDVVRVIPLP